MFDRDRNQPDRYQAPNSGAPAPYGPLPPAASGMRGGVMVNGERVAVGPREGFLTMSFVWMFVALLVSAVAAFFVHTNPSVQRFVLENYLILALGQLGFVFAISFLINKIGALPALALLFAYALTNGLVIGAVVLAYTTQGAAAGVVSAFLGASAIFGAAGLFGFVTKRDLTSLGGILFMGVIGLLVVSLVHFFLFPGSDTLNLIIGIGGVVIFTGLTAYDVQRLKNGHMPGIRDRESASVLGALALYIDFVVIFMSLLRIFGSGRD